MIDTSSGAKPADPWELALSGLPVPGLLRSFVVPSRIRWLYEQAAAAPADRFIPSILDAMAVGTKISDIDLSRIPRRGPLVVVSNHPFGLLEGLIVTRVLDEVRPDVKILANSLLGLLPEVCDRLILVDPFGKKGSVSSNARGVRQLLKWLRCGGALLSFPAGEVSHFNLRTRSITDPKWTDKIVHFARHTHSTVLPIYVCGANSMAFQVAGVIDARLRTAGLLHEFARTQRGEVEVRVGTAVAWDELEQIGSENAATEYLRQRTYLLKHRSSPHPVAGSDVQTIRRPIAPEISPALVEQEINRLRPEQRLVTNNGLEVYVAEPEQIPGALTEIGRLREIAFRAEGEGTGRGSDIDRFDAYYQHLFVWSPQERKIIGGYRLASSVDVQRHRGNEGLYTSTLFDYQEGFFTRLGPAMELGRSFVIPEYQKHYAPLLLLWKGISALIDRRPDHPVLFGAVSISNDYHPVSRGLIVQHLETHQRSPELAQLVCPRTPFKMTRRHTDNDAMRLMLRSVDELSSVTSDLEADGKGIPVLLKHYMRLGGKVLGFNVDFGFSQALDALIMVDLRRSPAAVLNRYLGRDGAMRFKAWHERQAETAGVGI